MKGFMIVSTFFSLWLAVFLNVHQENYLAIVLILSIGILHGTNDIDLIRKINNKKKTHSKIKIVGYYTVSIVLATLLFFYIPLIALCLFIVASGYHFGEQHLSKYLKSTSVLINLYFSFYGLVILGMLLYLNFESVAPIIKDITSFSISHKELKLIWMVMIILFLILSIILHLKNEIFKINYISELFYLLVFAIVFTNASLLWGFAIYFIIWHSLPSIVDQVKFLYGNNKKENFIRYVKSSFIYWLISIFALGILFFIFKNQKDTLISILFISLGAITFPHVWVISKLNK